MIVIDLSQRKVLAKQIVKAETFLSRLRGLVGHAPLGEGEGLWLPGCRGVHTFGMKFPLDIVFLSGRGIVLKCLSSLRPNRIGPVEWEAMGVLELPEGFIESKNVCLGDELLFED